MIIPVEIMHNQEVIRTYALVDSGASVSFINTHFVEMHQLPVSLDPSPMVYRLANGSGHYNTTTSTIG